MKNNSNDTNKTTEPGQFGIKFANVVFLFGVIYSFVIVILAGYQTYKIYAIFNYSVYALISLIFLILFGFGFRLSNRLKINLSLMLCSVAITVFVFEICLTFLPKKGLYLPFDNRTKREAIDSLRESSKEVYPNISPASFTKINGLSTPNGIIYPFGGISNVETVDCNELGYWSIYKADEYGFNNPKGLYRSNNVDIILTGDSMTQGQCVNYDENIASWIRKKGYHTISLGKAGNGPLIEYATLMEYAQPIKPKIVLWVFYENDIFDLATEVESMFLRNYLDKSDYSQNLILRQIEIDSLLKIINQDPSEIRNGATIKSQLINTMKLTNIRLILNISRKLNPSVFNKILLKTKELISTWNGKLYFVYLPSVNTVSNNKKYPYRRKILNLISEQSVPIIDIQKEVIAIHPDPLSLFPFRKVLHYNADGYRLIAEAITERLKADGIIPLTSRD